MTTAVALPQSESGWGPWAERTGCRRSAPARTPAPRSSPATGSLLLLGREARQLRNHRVPVGRAAPLKGARRFAECLGDAGHSAAVIDAVEIIGGVGDEACFLVVELFEERRGEL